MYSAGKSFVTKCFGMILWTVVDQWLLINALTYDDPVFHGGSFHFFMSAGFICLSPSKRSILKAFRNSNTPKSLFFDAGQVAAGP